MHDIICPDCGERFLGYDIAFDMSKYVLPLLYYNNTETENVDGVDFKFYVDEETIRKSNVTESTDKLFCDNPGGPGAQDKAFPFIVHRKMLFEYVVSKSGYEEEELLGILEGLSGPVSKNDFSRITKLQLSQISMMYHVLFGVSKQLVDEISIDDEHVRTALKVLNHLYHGREEEDAAHSLTFDVCIYSNNLNNTDKQYVPDILFVRRNVYYDILKKCCRYCGSTLPREFGYYKMKPVVLLGSHAAGKTSYLLSLLNTVLSNNPFTKELPTVTLQDDDNLNAFMGNINRFRNGLSPVKTDFKNVPILNLKIKDTIYSFIDWPGEKFINGDGADADYIYKSKRVITRAQHILFFLPPEQIDDNIKTSEENVTFNVMNLGQSLSWHFSFPERKKIKSVTYVINKVDKLKGMNNTSELFNAIDGKSEIDLYSNAWKSDVFDDMNTATERYIQQQNPQLYNVLNNVVIGNGKVTKNYLSVAPYGRDAAESQNSDKVIHEGFLAGAPFLRIIAVDGLI